MPQEALFMNIFGVWMWPKSVRMQGAEAVAARCAAIGVTDIYYLTKGLGGMTVYNSLIAPHSDRDLLREMLDAAHARGIRVHAWFTSACDEHYKALHPDSGRYHFTRGKDKPLISLADEGYLAYMEQITRELCRGYDVDGLHLDYIRYNHLLYGWSEDDLARYAAQGADPEHLRGLMQRMFRQDKPEETLLLDAYRAGDESVHALARARRQDVVRFASRLTGLARAERSDLILSAALMPEGAYDDLAFSDLHYGQNYEDAAKLYDFALPMAYSKAYEKDASWVRMVAEGTMKRGMKTVVGVHAYEGGTGKSLQADIAALEGSGVQGVCLFREGATVLAMANGRSVTLFNPLDTPITRIIAGDGEQTCTLATDIPSCAEKQLTLPFVPCTLQTFTGDKECCVYLAQG